MSYGEPGTRTGPRAEFVTRLLAALIDGAILFALSMVLVLALQDAGSALGFAAGIAYSVYLEGSPSGQTVGKKQMNIRVIDFDTGGPLGYGRAFLRYVCKVLSAIPCGLGYLWMLWDPQKQTWHDKLSTSVVVPTSAYPVEAWPG